MNSIYYSSKLESIYNKILPNFDHNQLCITRQLGQYQSPFGILIRWGSRQCMCQPMVSHPVTSQSNIRLVSFVPPSSGDLQTQHEIAASCARVIDPDVVLTNFRMGTVSAFPNWSVKGHSRPFLQSEQKHMRNLVSTCVSLSASVCMWVREGSVCACVCVCECLW